MTSNKNGHPRTLFEKVWENHLVKPQTPDTPAVLYIGQAADTRYPGSTLY